MFPLQALEVDAPDATSGPRKLVFVSGETFAGNSLGGLVGADQKCNAEAQQAGLSGTFMAWLSDSTGSPATRFTRGSGYQLVNGSVVANSFEDLTDGMLLASIALDAMGGTPASPFICSGAEVWTNTTVQGEAGTESCGDWSNDVERGSAGHSSRVDEAWTTECPTIACFVLLPIYCFEQ